MLKGCRIQLQSLWLPDRFDARWKVDHFSGDYANTRGWSDFFGLGVMSAGFDEDAWAAKGLPTSGNIMLKLTVKDVIAS
jgi:hypothetical protein